MIEYNGVSFPEMYRRVVETKIPWHVENVQVYKSIPSPFSHYFYDVHAMPVRIWIIVLTATGTMFG